MQSETAAAEAAEQASANHVEEREHVVIRFAGDSGDGMQLAGMHFTNETALAGNDLSTLPDFPAEIRAPAGTLAGVSGFQLHFSSQDVFTPGDTPDVLVAMNPAALKVNVGDLQPNGILIVDKEQFTEQNTKKAEFATNPLTDGSLDRFQLFQVEISKLTINALRDMQLPTRTMMRSRNFFALGLTSWLFHRPIEPTIKWIEQRFKKNAPLAEANVRVLKAGYNFGETTEMFRTSYRVKPAAIAPGHYRNITGNAATALGFVAAARRAGRPLFLGSYPITPASDILHELSTYKNFNVYTFQAEDEIAGVGAALGAAFGGAVAITTTSGPGVCLKAETINLAVSVELPLVIADIQRGGPSTGLPTKTEQADLLLALYGRNSDSPVPILAPATPAECFRTAFEAVRIAVTYMTPVFLLSDGYLANGAEPWEIPKADSLPPIEIQFRTDPKGYYPYLRDPTTLSRPWAIPGTPGPRAPHRRPREGLPDRQRQLRTGQPRADGAGALPQDRRHRARDPADRDPRPRGRRPAGDRLGKHVRCDRVGDPRAARGRKEGLARAPALPQPAAFRPRRHPGAVQEGAGAGAEPRPTAQGAARRVPHRRRRPEQDPGTAVQGERDHRQGAAPAGGMKKMSSNAAVPKLTRKDFVTNQDVRWCPGCGDYSILAQVQKLLPELGVPREKSSSSPASAARAASRTT